MHSNTWTTCLYGSFKAPTKRLKNILHSVSHLWRFAHLISHIKIAVWCHTLNTVLNAQVCLMRCCYYCCSRLRSSPWSRTCRRLRRTCPGSWLMLSRWVFSAPHTQTHQLACFHEDFPCFPLSFHVFSFAPSKTLSALSSHTNLSTTFFMRKMTLFPQSWQDGWLLWSSCAASIK